MLVEKNDVKGLFSETERYFRQYQEPFDEYERLARNQPSDKIAANLPRTTDGTLAGIVQEKPKRVIQTTPTGVVTCKDYPEFDEIAGYVLQNEIIPMENLQGSALQKSLIILGKAFTYGGQPSFTFFTQTGEKMHTDYVLPYIRDVYPEKGKVFAPDSNVSFMRAWYTKYDLKKIIAREEKLKEKDKSYKTTWNLKKLSELIDTQTEELKEFQTPAERESSSNTGGYQIIHVFQTGEDGEFYSFSPSLGEKDILRTWANPDPRGAIPINWLYNDIDLSNPYGRGIVEASAGVQNLVDQQMQMFQFISTMQMAPPQKIWGSVNKATIKYRPNAIWDMGNSPNNKVEAETISNTSISNFPNVYGLLKSQILNQNSSLDNSISAESGNPGFSKTPAGVKANNERLSVTDQYARNQFEAWYQAQKETSLNIFLSEMEGEGEIEVSKEDVETTTLQVLEEFFDFEKGVLNIPYSEMEKIAFKFKVNAGSSKEDQMVDRAERLTAALDLALKTPNPEVQRAVPELFKRAIKQIGIKDVDTIFSTDDTIKSAQAEESMQQGVDPAVANRVAQNTGQPQEMVQGQPQQVEAINPQEGQMLSDEIIQPQGQPPQPQEQPLGTEPLGGEDGLDEEEMAFVQELIQMGLSKEQIAAALTLSEQGVPEDEIIQRLGLDG